MKRSLCAAAVVIVAVASPAAGETAVTFNKDVAPILYARCAACHRPGEIGPFSVLTYRDARQHATQIADVTARRVMPPWKPEHGKGTFVGDRSLSDDEIRLLQAWVAQGAKEGDAGDLPAAPQGTTGWAFGTPDLVVTMPAPYTLQAGGTDVFRTFVIPIPTSAARYVKAIEFRPGNARAVHHANLGVDRTGSSRRLDALDAEPGYVGGMVPDAAYPPGYMLGWTPGQRPRPSPEGMAWRLEAGSDLVVQLHMQPTGKPEPVQVSAGLFFTEDAPVRTPVGLRLGSETIDIQPGDARYTDLRQLRAAGERRCARRAAARAQSGAPDGGRRNPARSDHRPAHLDRRLGFSLAGRLSLRASAEAPARHDDLDAVHVRQLGRECPQSDSWPCGVGAEHLG